MIDEIETKTHIIVNSKELLKITKIVRHKVAKMCVQSFYKELLSILEKKNSEKILFLFSKTPKIFEQFWSEIYVDGILQDSYSNLLMKHTKPFIDNYDLLQKLQSLAELSEDGKVFLSFNDGHVYNNLKKYVSLYNHDEINNVNNQIFEEIVKLVYKLP